MLIAFALSVAPAWAGTDVSLCDAQGNLLGKAELARADMQATCGDCHSVGRKADQLHFNKRSATHSANCLTCHLRDGERSILPDGTMPKLSAKPPDAACLSCHPATSSKCRPNTADAHATLACIDCHLGAGHKTAVPVSCTGCHNGRANAPKPTHAGFTAVHMRRIACETCHIGPDILQKTQVLAYAVQNGRILPINSSGEVVHHPIAKASFALGAGGCTDCHSMARGSFFGSVASAGGYTAWPLRTRADRVFGALREGIIKPLAGWAVILVIALSVAHYAIFGPRHIKTVRGEPTVERFSAYERMVHALATCSFAFLAVTGLMFLLRLESPSDTLRGLHGHAGGLFVVSLAGVIATWHKHARFCVSDRVWLRRFGGYIWIQGACPAGKFNAGQKLFFWMVAAGTGTLVCVTGVLLTADKGEAAGWVFTLHDFAALVMILGVLGHIYLAVFANPGSLKAIVTGRVAKRWARHHHPDWLIVSDTSNIAADHSDDTFSHF